MRYSLAKMAVLLRTSVLPGWPFGLWAGLRGVPDWRLYRPTFHPWLQKEFRKKYRKISDHTLVSAEGAWILSALAQQALTLDGDFLEAGVYRGGTARLLHDLVRSAAKTRRLHLFDTFQGMPETNPARDRHKSGDFHDTSLESVSAFVGRADEYVHYYKGLIPDTFASLTECRFAFAHVDVDIHRSVLDCCEYIYPRLNSGGIMLFDDYGMPSCPGARLAVDTFFAGRPEIPIVLSTGQGIIFRR